MTFEIKINDRLSLRIPAIEDAKDIYTVIDKDRDHLKQWLVWVDDVKSFENTETNIKKRIEDFEKKEAASFFIYYENQWIGSVGFISIDNDNHNGEIGYWLSSAFEGKGLMTECVKACVRYGFEDLNLHRILIKCDADNVKSAGIPKRLGFILEGTLREDKNRQDHYRNTSMYGLLKGEGNG
jgi:ribosomal-protein-serine acetyltransferase